MNPSRISAKVAAVGAALALVSAPALAAAEKVKVVVLPYAPLYDSIPRATGEQIAKTLENGLKSQDGVQLVELPAEGASAGGVAVTGASADQVAAVKAAVEDVEKGKKLLAKRKVKPALDAFTRAIQAMDANGAAVLDTEPLVEANLKQAVALFLMGREDQAAKGPVPAALRINPALQLEAGAEYGQVFVDMVERVRAEIAKETEGSLRVDTTPPGAKIWVDGREADYSPVMVKGIVPGRHFIKIKPPGADPYVQVVEIKAGQLFKISPDQGAKKEGPVASLVTLLSKNELNADAQKQAAAMAKKTGAQVVVVGGAYAKASSMGIVAYAYSAKENGFAELQNLNLDRDMLGATIEINKVAAEIGGKGTNVGTLVSLPRPMAADAKPGAEKISEVDFSGTLAASAAKPKDEVKKASTRDEGPRRPVNKRRPVGAGMAPEAAAPAPAADPVAEAPAETTAPVVAEAPAPAPASDFADAGNHQDPSDFADTTKPATTEYKTVAGSGIEDETAFEDGSVVPPPATGGGLLSKWWFWAAAGVVAAGAVGGYMAADGGSDATGATGTVSW